MRVPRPARCLASTGGADSHHVMGPAGGAASLSALSLGIRERELCRRQLRASSGTSCTMSPGVKVLGYARRSCPMG
jgi:hypothetical protein